eukprot:13777752-Heterocapsa_arctica.AAC.1
MISRAAGSLKFAQDVPVSSLTGFSLESLIRFEGDMLMGGAMPARQSGVFLDSSSGMRGRIYFQPDAQHLSWNEKRLRCGDR